MANITTKQAGAALRKAGLIVGYVTTRGQNDSAEARCRKLSEALGLIQDAQIVLRNDACWRERAEADMLATRRG
jgi:hypothetical protein